MIHATYTRKTSPTNHARSILRFSIPSHADARARLLGLHYHSARSPRARTKRDRDLSFCNGNVHSIPSEPDRPARSRQPVKTSSEATCVGVRAYTGTLGSFSTYIRVQGLRSCELMRSFGMFVRDDSRNG